MKAQNSLAKVNVLIACSFTKTNTKTKTKTKAFVRSCMFWNKHVTNEPIIICKVVLRAWFNRHMYYLERMKTFVLGFIFVFVLAHEQAISMQSRTTGFVFILAH